MSEEMKAKRQALAALSNTVAPLIDSGDFETINAALVAMYQEQGHTTINSFRKWKEQGMSVRKGEKALLLWGQPRTAARQEKTADEKDEYKFFPLAYVFSDKQVEPSKHLAK